MKQFFLDHPFSSYSWAPAIYPVLGQKYHREEIGHSPACHGAYDLGGEKDVSQKQTLNMHFLGLMNVSAKDGSPGKVL